MDEMRKNVFYLLSVLSLLIALGFHFAGHQRILAGQRLKAEGIESAMKQQTQPAVNAAAMQLSRSARLLNAIGGAWALCGLVCVVVARARGEFGWYSVPMLLLAGDVVVLMLL